MSPPASRPIPRFIADASQHGIPHGRFAERLHRAFDENGELYSRTALGGTPHFAPTPVSSYTRSRRRSQSTIRSSRTH